MWPGSQEVDFLVSSWASTGGAPGFPPAFDYREHLLPDRLSRNSLLPALDPVTISTRPGAILYQKGCGY